MKNIGGVVPEIASRKHIEVISQVVKQALEEAKMKFEDIDAVACTYGPGLVRSFISSEYGYAKALSYAISKPLVRSKPYRRSYCSKLYNISRIRARIFMLGNIRGTYTLS